MTWNWRVLRYKDGTLGIHEAYYDDKGKVEGWTQDAIITGDSVTDLLKQLALMRKDIIKYKDDILDYGK